MKTLYLDCSMGAAGDMLAAALLELYPDPEPVLERLNHLGLPGITFQAERSVKCGITGTHMAVRVNGVAEESRDYLHKQHKQALHAHSEHEQALHGHEHSAHEQAQQGNESHGHEHSAHEQAQQGNESHGHEHSAHEQAQQGHEHGHHEHAHGHTQHHAHQDLQGIHQIVSELALPEIVRKDVLAVYELIAQAESQVHGCPVTEIHFHEVGSLDAVADVTAVCMMLRDLAPDRIVASAVHVGSGQVHCAHGILPVPAPAAAWLLRGIPTYGGQIRGELCTPTGAALLRYFVQEYGSQPPMQVERIGYGCGQKDFEMANCVRAMLGDTAQSGDSILELCCNLDDMTPEAIGYAMERLFAEGALDVYTTAVGMKKNRPGVMLTCMCKAQQREKMVAQMFLHTTTLGIRESVCNRYTLHRAERMAATPYGDVRIKQATGFGVCREKAEYEDLAQIARQQSISLAQAAELINAPHNR